MQMRAGCCPCMSPTLPFSIPCSAPGAAAPSQLFSAFRASQRHHQFMSGLSSSPPPSPHRATLAPSLGCSTHKSFGHILVILWPLCSLGSGHRGCWGGNLIPPKPSILSHQQQTEASAWAVPCAELRANSQELLCCFVLD